MSEHISTFYVKKKVVMQEAWSRERVGEFDASLAMGISVMLPSSLHVF